jgi:hypothetical protein
MEEPPSKKRRRSADFHLVEGNQGPSPVTSRSFKKGRDVAPSKITHVVNKVNDNDKTISIKEAAKEYNVPLNVIRNGLSTVR